MKLKNIFGSDELDIDEVGQSEEYVEVSHMDASRGGSGRLAIRVERLEDFADTDRVLKALRRGSVVFLKIKGLKDKDMGELKRAVEKLKKTALANNGDIAGVENDWLIITPEFAIVERE
ncbi:MAG: cell division protein SepF [Nanoarchaeota archaeon]|nr:cell division protein SepF [Nanoarchaeota archaeon]